MKNQSEKQPIDDLFARKLGNMSLPPSADGFERLQARMGKRTPEARVVFWQNPSVQRYMAAAACLILVSLFGWLYWPSGKQSVGEEKQLAASTDNKQVDSHNHSPKVEVKRQGEDNQATYGEAKTPEVSQSGIQEQLAVAEKPANQVKQQDRFVSPSPESHRVNTRPAKIMSQESAVAQNKTVETAGKQEVVNTLPIDKPTTSEQVAEVKPVTKPTAPVERVLVVTIAEPEALVAARQAAKASVEEKSVVAAVDKQEKDAKATGLWQQVKRFKEGELFARRDNDNSSSEDRGLLGRAYSGIKHSLDKDKSSKQ